MLPKPSAWTVHIFLFSSKGSLWCRDPEIKLILFSDLSILLRWHAKKYWNAETSIIRIFCWEKAARVYLYIHIYLFTFVGRGRSFFVIIFSEPFFKCKWVPENCLRDVQVVFNFFLILTIAELFHPQKIIWRNFPIKIFMTLRAWRPLKLHKG